MRTLLFVLACAAGSAYAQPSPAPYDVSPGDHVRVTVAAAPGASSRPLVGRVGAVEADSMWLAGAPIAWTHVAAVDRRQENRSGETLGLLVGGLVGGLAGYVLGDVLTGDPLGRVALVPGALGGLLVGGTVGAHLGDRWAPVAPSRPALGVRAVLPLR